MVTLQGRQDQNLTQFPYLDLARTRIISQYGQPGSDNHTHNSISTKHHQHVRTPPIVESYLLKE